MKNLYHFYNQIKMVDVLPGGAYELDREGKFLERLLEYQGFSKHFIEQYNTWIEQILPEQISSETLRIPERENVVITFSNVTVHSPKVRKAMSADGGEPLYPFNARMDGLNYFAQIYLDMNLVDRETGTVIDTERGVYAGSFPVLIGPNSTLCNLNGKDAKELINLGEDPFDPFNYAIINGAERSVTTQKKGRVNRYLIYPMKSKINKNNGLMCTMTCASITGSSVISLVFGKQQQVKLHMRMFGKTYDKTLPVILVFRFLAGWENTDILKMIEQFVSNPNTRNKIFTALTASFIKAEQESNDIVNYIWNKWEVKEYNGQPAAAFTPDQKREVVYTELEKELFPHMRGLEMGSADDSLLLRLQLLAMMVTRLLECTCGYRIPEDRDDLSNVRFEIAARSMENLFMGLWKKVIVKTQEQIEKSDIKNKTLKNVVSLLQHRYIQEEMTDSFSSANWGVKPYKGVRVMKENVAEILKRDSLVATLAQIRKINTPTNRKMKKSKVRFVSHSHLGYIDPADVPEGENCGLTQYFTVICSVSVERREGPLLSKMTSKKKVTVNPTTSHQWCAILNGKLLGWCDGPKLYQELLKAKRSLVIYRDTCLVLDRSCNTLFVYCDAARPVRPLLVVNEDQKLVIEEKNLWDASIDELLRQGCLEYLDAWEADQKITHVLFASSIAELNTRTKEVELTQELLATIDEDIEKVQRGIDVIREATIDGFKGMKRVTVDDLLVDRQNISNRLTALHRRRKITHCELDPQALLGVATSIIPLPNHNQAPRNTYQASMGKQAMGYYHSNLLNRFDATVKVLAFPQRPLFEPQMNRMIGLDQRGTGHNMVAAIFADPSTSEDSFVLNRSAVDRGLGMYIKYSALKSVLKSGKGITEIFTKPKVSKHESAEIYSAIDDQGTPIVGKEVKPGMCVVGKMRIFREEGVVRKEENVSSFMTARDYGRIDRVHRGTNPDNQTFIRVRIRDTRRPTEGDKLASRHAQKGTIAQIRSGEDMPWIGRAAEHIGILQNIHDERLMIDRLQKRLEWLQQWQNNLKAPQWNAFRPFWIHELMTQYELLQDKLLKTKFSTHFGEVSQFFKTLLDLKLGELPADLTKKVQMTSKPLEDRVAAWVAKERTMSVAWVQGTAYYIAKELEFVPQYMELIQHEINEKEAIHAKFGRKPNEPSMEHGLQNKNPDIMINPHSIPSRMTMGKMIEFIAGTQAAATGNIINATAFRPVNIDEIGAALRSCGLSPSGKYELYDGRTGRLLNTLVYIGIVHYQFLRHTVMDKIQARGEGGVKRDTHQPTHGRSVEGGLRVGEMERDAIISHGASELLNERLCKLSDGFKAGYCAYCGTMTNRYITPTTRCRYCNNDKPEFFQVEIPWVFKLVIDFLVAAGVNVGYHLAKQRTAAFEYMRPHVETERRVLETVHRASAVAVNDEEDEREAAQDEEDEEVMIEGEEVEGEEEFLGPPPETFEQEGFAEEED